jgi:uncharacterized membrane protein
MKEKYIPNDEPLLRVEKKLKKVEKKFDDTTLAMEMLQELKKSSQHKFIIIVILIIALIVTNVGWLLYESSMETVAETEETIIDSGNGIATYLENSESGDINYGENN